MGHSGTELRDPRPGIASNRIIHDPLATLLGGGPIQNQRHKRSCKSTVFYDNHTTFTKASQIGKQADSI